MAALASAPLPGPAHRAAAMASGQRPPAHPVTAAASALLPPWRRPARLPRRAAVRPFTAPGKPVRRAGRSLPLMSDDAPHREPEPPHATGRPVDGPAAHADADLTVDGTGLLCVTLLLRLRRAIGGAPPGTVVHVVATDPAAPLDLPAWCHMTGHTYLGPVAGGRPVYAIRLAADARATRPDAPWHPLPHEAQAPTER